MYSGELISNRVFVGGLPMNTTILELQEFFSKLVDDCKNVKDVNIITDQKGTCKGFGFVTFESENETKKILNLAQELLVFKSINIKVANAYRSNSIRSTHVSSSSSNVNYQTKMNCCQIQSVETIAPERLYMSPNNEHALNLVSPNSPTQLASIKSSQNELEEKSSLNKANNMDHFTIQQDNNNNNTTAKSKDSNKTNKPKAEQSVASSSSLFSSSSRSSNTKTFPNANSYRSLQNGTNRFNKQQNSNMSYLNSQIAQQYYNSMIAIASNNMQQQQQQQQPRHQVLNNSYKQNIYNQMSSVTNVKNKPQQSSINNTGDSGKNLTDVNEKTKQDLQANSNPQQQQQQQFSSATQSSSSSSSTSSASSSSTTTFSSCSLSSSSAQQRFNSNNINNNTQNGSSSSSTSSSSSSTSSKEIENNISNIIQNNNSNAQSKSANISNKKEWINASSTDTTIQQQQHQNLNSQTSVSPHQTQLQSNNQINQQQQPQQANVISHYAFYNAGYPLFNNYVNNGQRPHHPMLPALKNFNDSKLNLNVNTNANGVASSPSPASSGFATQQQQQSQQQNRNTQQQHQQQQQPSNQSYQQIYFAPNQQKTSDEAQTGSGTVATISNAFETANGISNNNEQALSTDNLEELMKKNLNIQQQSHSNEFINQFNANSIETAKYQHYMPQTTATYYYIQPSYPHLTFNQSTSSNAHLNTPPPPLPPALSNIATSAPQYYYYCPAPPPLHPSSGVQQQQSPQQQQQHLQSIQVPPTNNNQTRVGFSSNSLNNLNGFGVSNHQMHTYPIPIHINTLNSMQQPLQQQQHSYNNQQQHSQSNISYLTPHSAPYHTQPPTHVSMHASTFQAQPISLPPPRLPLQQQQQQQQQQPPQQQQQQTALLNNVPVLQMPSFSYMQPSHATNQQYQHHIPNNMQKITQSPQQHQQVMSRQIHYANIQQQYQQLPPPSMPVPPSLPQQQKPQYAPVYLGVSNKSQVSGKTEGGYRSNNQSTKNSSYNNSASISAPNQNTNLNRNNNRYETKFSGKQTKFSNEKSKFNENETTKPVNDQVQRD